MRHFSSFVNLRHRFAQRTLWVLVRLPSENRAPAAEAETAAARPFFAALAGLLRHPQRILFLWNWKSAWLSIILRGPIFLGAAIQKGFGTAVSALLTECLFCAATAGFYGAFVQNLRDAEPEWMTLSFLTLILPGIFQILEYLLHRVRGTPHLRIAEIVSVLASGISAFFNWYAMRRGALLVGGEGDTFASDLRRLPALILSFVNASFRFVWHRGTKQLF